MTSLAAVSEKLGHSLDEVRQRAFQSLEFKVKHGLVGASDFQDRNVLVNILGRLFSWILQIRKRPSSDTSALLLLSKLAGMPHVGKAMVQLGIDDVLNDLKSSRADNLHLAIDSTRSAILAAIGTSNATATLSTFASAPGQPTMFGFSPSKGTPQSGKGQGDRLSSDARALVTKMRAERKVVNPGTAAAPGGVDGVAMAVHLIASPTDWMLCKPPISAEEEQHLHELITRLKYMQDPRICGPALTELMHGSAADFPPELRGQSPTGDTCLLILGSVGTHDPLFEASASLLLRVTRGLKASLSLATDSTFTPGSAHTQAGRGSEWGSCGGSEHQAEEAEADAEGPCRGGGKQAQSWQMLDRQTDYFFKGALALAAPLKSAIANPAAETVSDGDDSSDDGEGGEEIAEDAEAAVEDDDTVFSQLSNPERHFHLLPIVEELLPLLLIGNNGLQMSDISEKVRTKCTMLMQPLGQALQANLAIARAEAPATLRSHLNNMSLVDAGGGWSECPLVVNPAAAAVFCVIANLAAVARDEVLCSLIPGIREAVLPALQYMRPDVQRLLGAATEGDRAMLMADKLVWELPHLLSGTLPPMGWLTQLPEAVAALELTPASGVGQEVDLLLMSVMRGLSFICSSDSLEGDGVQQVAQLHLLKLLSHPLPVVQLAVLGMVESLLNGVSPTASIGSETSHHPMLHVLAGKKILQWLVVVGLGTERLRPQVVRILMQMMQSGHQDSIKGLSHWITWVCLNEEDAQCGALISALQHCQRTAVGSLHDGDWSKMKDAIRLLFSRHSSHRLEASRNLLDAMQYAGLPTPPSEQYNEPHMSDPLKVCLDNGARDDLTLSSNPRLSQTFRTQDVSNLLAILGNPSLAPELQRSAAEQLTSLSVEPRLQGAMASAESVAVTLNAACAFLNKGDGATHMHVRRSVARLFSALVFLGEAGKWEGWQQVHAMSFNKDPQQGTTAPHSTESTTSTGLRLPSVFASAYLYPCRVAWLHVDAATFMASTYQDDGSSFESASFGHLLKDKPKLQGILSEQRGFVQVLVEERRLLQAAGSLKALVEMVEEEARPSGLSPVASLACITNIRSMLLQPRVELQGAMVEQEARPSGLSPVASLVSITNIRSMLLQPRVELQVYVANICIARRAAIQGAERLQALGAMVEQEARPSGLSPVASLVSITNIRSMLLQPRVELQVLRVSSAGSHAECGAALRSLLSLCASRAGAQALAGSSWQEGFGHLLSAPPASLDDRQLWLQLLPLLQLYHANVQQPLPAPPESAVPILSMPKASHSAPLLPVGLAGIDALVLAMDSEATHSQQQQQLTFSLTLSSLQTLSMLLSKTVAMGLLVEVLSILIEAQRLPPSPDSNSNKQVSADGSDALLDCFVKLVTHVLATAASVPSLATQSRSKGRGQGPSAANMAKEGACRGTYRGKGQVRTALSCLNLLTQVLSVDRWSAAWQESSGIFWLSRLTRDADARIRTQALVLLSKLISPGASPTQRLLTTAWHDVTSHIVDVALGGGIAGSSSSRQRMLFAGSSADEKVSRKSPLECPGAHAASLKFVALASIALASIALSTLTSLLAGSSADDEVGRKSSMECPYKRAAALQFIALAFIALSILASLPAGSSADDEAGRKSSMECAGARAAALQFIALALALPTQDQELPWSAAQGHDKDTLLPRAPPLGPEALLQQGHLWEQLPVILLEGSASAALTSAALALLLQGLVVDPETFMYIVKYPGVLHLLLELRDPSFLTDKSRTQAALLTQQLQYRVTSLTAQPLLNPELAGAGQRPGSSALLLQGSTAHSSTNTYDGLDPSVGLDVLLGVDGSTQYTGRTGSNLMCTSRPGQLADPPQPSMEPDSIATATAPPKALQCCTLSATILSHVFRQVPYSPAPLDLPSLGLPALHVATHLLTAICNLADRVALLTPSSAAPTTAAMHCPTDAPAQELLLTHAHLKAIQSVASAVCGLLQGMQVEEIGEAAAAGMQFDEIGEAAAAAEGRLKEGRRSNNRAPPLMVVLAGLLAPEQLGMMDAGARLAVISLLACLLQEEGLAKGLLHQDPDSSDTNALPMFCMCPDKEHICPTGGHTVGAGLCLALVGLLPQDALTISCNVDGSLVAGPLEGPPDGGGHAQSAQALLLDGAESACVLALRNVLAFSNDAKFAALRAGLHDSLLHSCRVAVQLQQAAVRRVGAASNMGAGVRASIASTTIMASPASVKGGRSQSSAGLRKGGRLGGPRPGAEVMSPSRSPMRPSGGLAQAGGQEQLSSAVYSKLSLCLSLLKHLVYQSTGSKQVILKQGVMGVSAGLWSHCFVLPARSGSAGSQAAWVGIRSVASSCVVASSVQGKGQDSRLSRGQKPARVIPYHIKRIRFITVNDYTATRPSLQ
eukprot:gene21728-28749_t